MEENGRKKQSNLLMIIDKNCSDYKITSLRIKDYNNKNKERKR